jgi:hypothetical protein
MPLERDDGDKGAPQIRLTLRAEPHTVPSCALRLVPARPPNRPTRTPGGALPTAVVDRAVAVPPVGSARATEPDGAMQHAGVATSTAQVAEAACLGGCHSAGSSLSAGNPVHASRPRVLDHPARPSTSLDNIQGTPVDTAAAPGAIVHVLTGQVAEVVARRSQSAWHCI